MQLDLLRHINDECDFLHLSATPRKLEEIQNDPVLSRAVVRSLEIIGEATKQLPEEFRIRYPQIDWKSIAKMRDKLIHHYSGIDYEIVYDTLQKHIPEFRAEIQRILTLEK